MLPEKRVSASASLSCGVRCPCSARRTSSIVWMLRSMTSASAGLLRVASELRCRLFMNAPRALRPSYPCNSRGGKETSELDFAENVFLAVDPDRQHVRQLSAVGRVLPRRGD